MNQSSTPPAGSPDIESLLNSDGELMVRQDSEPSKLRSLSVTSSNNKGKTVITKVPLSLRAQAKDDDIYDPKVVSLGPYHHGKPKLQLMEDYKHKVLEFYILNTKWDAATSYDVLLEDINEVRDFYVPGSTDGYSDAELTRMMIQDACFLLHVMEIVARKSEAATSFAQKYLGLGTLYAVCNDIQLLENQIPLWILRILATSMYHDDKCGDAANNDRVENYLKDLLGRFCASMISGKSSEIELNSRDVLCVHVLELFRKFYVSKQSNHESVQPKVQLLPTFQNYFRSKIFRKQSEHAKPLESMDLAYHFRSVTDLKAKGILFRPSDLQTLKGIKFKSYYFFGKLSLPKFSVDTSTIITYANLIAYELSPGVETNYEILTFANFMKSLITSADDVKELREQQILINTVGTDEEAAKVVQAIPACDMFSYGTLQIVMQKIQHHISSKKRTLTAELFWTYFSSPWSFIGLLIATVVVGLTIVQTYFTIHPIN